MYWYSQKNLTLVNIVVGLGVFCFLLLFLCKNVVAIEAGDISFANCSSLKAKKIKQIIRSQQSIISVTSINVGIICRFKVRYSGETETLAKAIQAASGNNLKLRITHVSSEAIRFVIQKDVNKKKRKAGKAVVRDRDKQKQPIRETQRLLTELGIDPGPIDGVIGSQTRLAIKAFQRERNISVTGKPSSTLLALLNQEIYKIGNQSIDTDVSQKENHNEHFTDNDLGVSTFSSDQVLLSSPTLRVPYYARPDILAVKKGFLPAGTSIASHRKIKDFLEVTINGETAYIFSSFCKRFYRK